MVEIRNNGPTVSTLGLLFQRGYWYEVSDDVANAILSKSANFEKKQEGGSPPPVSTSEEEVAEKIVEEETVDYSSMTKRQLQDYLTSLAVPFRKLDTKSKLLEIVLSLDEEE
tara:strand:+ start:265 stop:600 length:336 start_codon:yes stop_codon:yes gene_type:complete